MVDLATFDRAVDALPDWERMPGPQSSSTRRAAAELDRIVGEFAVRRAEARAEFERKMRRIEFMERTTFLIVGCFVAGVLLAAALQSCHHEPAAATFLEAQP